MAALLGGQILLGGTTLERTGNVLTVRRGLVRLGAPRPIPFDELVHASIRVHARGPRGGSPRFAFCLDGRKRFVVPTELPPECRAEIVDRLNREIAAERRPA